MSSDKRKKVLAGLAFGGHIFVIILLWFVLRENNIEEPVFEKVISASITTKVPSRLPLLSKAERVKAEKERRQNEESAWKKQQNTLKKKYEAEAKKKKEAELKKAAEAKKKKESKKKPPVKEKDNSKKKSEDKKKIEKQKELDRIKKQQELAKKKAAEAKKKADEQARKEKALADKLAREANARRQAVLGKHVTTDIVSRLTVEWNKGGASIIQFDDPNDFVTIRITVARNGSLISAKVTKRAKSSSLNAKAAALIGIISRPGYRFPAFNKAYNKSSMTLSRNFRTK